MQLGLDVATNISVFMAMIVFSVEKKKDREARIREFKLQRSTEIIQYLNEKLHRLLPINGEIDNKLRLSKKAKYRGKAKVEIPREEMRRIELDTRDNPHRFRTLPEEFMVSPLIEEIVSIVRDMNNYLSHHPYIQFLRDESVSKQIDSLIDLHRILTQTTSDPGVDNRTLLMKVRDSERNPRLFRIHLRKEAKSNERSKLSIITKVSRDEIEKQNCDREEKERQIEEVCVAAFSESGLEGQKRINKKFVIMQLENISSLRDEWLAVTKEVNRTIKALSDYTYKIIW